MSAGTDEKTSRTGISNEVTMRPSRKEEPAQRDGEGAAQQSGQGGRPAEDQAEQEQQKQLQEGEESPS